MKKMNVKKACISFSAILALGLFSSCDALQETLSSEQTLNQNIDIGEITCDTSVFYYNGAEGESVKGDEGHIVLDLGQYANADAAGVSYTLTYRMDGVTRTATADGTGTLSDSASKYYVDVSPAINLLDGSDDVADDDIELALSVSGLVNASGNDYNGYTMAKYTTTLSFEPLFTGDPLAFSTKSAPIGTKYSLSLNGAVSLSDSASISWEASDGSALPSGASLSTLAVSEDGKTLYFKVNGKKLTGEDFVADITVSGLKPVGVKESYTYTFENVYFTTGIVIDGSLEDEDWESATVSTAHYATEEGYTINKVMVTNDDTYLYLGLEGDFSFVSGDRLIVMIDNSSSSDAGKSSSDSDYNSYYGPATTATFSSVDFYLSHFLYSSEMQDYYWVSSTGRTDVTTSADSATESAIEYKIPLSAIASAATGNTLRIFVTATSYQWTTQNEMTLRDCIPSAAATISDSGQTLSVDFDSALEYTLE